MAGHFLIRKPEGISPTNLFDSSPDDVGNLTTSGTKDPNVYFHLNKPFLVLYSIRI